MSNVKKKRRIGIAVGLTVIALAIIPLIIAPTSPDFTEYEAGEQRKEAFFNYFLPIVEKRNQQIRVIRQELLVWHQTSNDLGWWDRRKLKKLAENYGMESFDISADADWTILLRRVDIVPPSLALAQAANESAWGTSRFAMQGNNYFGQWCYNKGCGIVPGSRDSGRAHEVEVFDSPEESVRRYINNLNSHDAYVPLRLIREDLRAKDKRITGDALVAGLNKYSERGDDYIKELSEMMQFNKLTEYDRATQ